jgi:hypothetical protein
LCIRLLCVSGAIAGVRKTITDALRAAGLMK